MRELFEFPPTRSNRARWALEELGVPYARRIVDFTNGEQRGEQHRRLHPLGHVPAYRTGAYTMFESVAIVMQLIDEHPERGLAPSPGDGKRAEYYQWCVAASAEFDHVLLDIMKHTMHLPNGQRVAAIAERAQSRFRELGEMLSGHLASRPYLLGDAFSGADIAIGYCCNWAAYVGKLEDHAVVAAYYERLRDRPAFRRVFEPAAERAR